VNTKGQTNFRFRTLEFGCAGPTSKSDQETFETSLALSMKGGSRKGAASLGTE